jgi:hypothetical protein
MLCEEVNNMTRGNDTKTSPFARYRPAGQIGDRAATRNR